jgi:hypothetical protein
MTAVFHTPAQGPLTLAVTGPAAELTVRTLPGLTDARLEVSGPADVIERASAVRDGDQWTLTLPDTGTFTTTASSGGGVVNNHVGSIGSGATLIQAGNIHGDVHLGRSQGLTVQSAATAQPTVRVGVDLPEHAHLDVRLDTGSVRTTGHLGQVSADTTSADVTIGHARDVSVDTTSGTVTVSTVLEAVDVTTISGTVCLNTTAPRTRVRTTSGRIDINASGAHRVRARSTSGTITVDHSARHGAVVDATSTGGTTSIR